MFLQICIQKVVPRTCKMLVQHKTLQWLPTFSWLMGTTLTVKWGKPLMSGNEAHFISSCNEQLFSTLMTQSAFMITKCSFIMRELSQLKENMQCSDERPNITQCLITQARCFLPKTFQKFAERCHHYTTVFKCLISVINFKQLKSNWNIIGKYLQMTVKNPIFQTEIQPFWDVLKRF